MTRPATRPTQAPPGGILSRLFARRALTEANAQGLLGFLQGLGSLWQTTSGAVVTPEGSLQSTTVFACVRVLTGAIASLPMLTYRRRADGGRDRATNHYLYPVLHDVTNGEMTAFEWRECTVGHLALWGNAYSEIEENNAGQVIGLWPLRPDRVLPRRNPSTKQIEYVVQVPKGGPPVVLPAERVMHVRGLGTSGLFGLSPIQMARQAIGLSLAAEEFGARFFANGATPGLVLHHPGLLSDEAYKRLKESWKEQHEGLSNAQRTAILEEGVTVEKIGIPPEDAQFLETRKFQVADIARVYGIPPHMVGDVERSTSWGTGIEQQGIGFVTYTLDPWLVRIEQRAGMSLLMPAERREYFIQFLVDALLRADTQARYAAYNTARQGGWMSVNEIRSRENMNPIPGGDTYLSPLNMTPVGAPAGGDAGAPASDAGGGADDEGTTV
jgi:HK97 family phage portal protein